MAKKRLNKRVALIGSAVFVVLVLITVAAILYLSRDPRKFIEDGDLALQSAREAVDEQRREELYTEAERNYHKARSLAKSDSLKIEMFFRLIDVYVDTDEWRNVIGCWNGIIQLDPENLRARYGRLKYFYTMANGGVDRVWQEVASQASEFIEIVESSSSASELLARDTAALEPAGFDEKAVHGEHLGTHLYLLRGRASLEMVKLGAVTNKEESLDTAVADLEKVRELNPKCVEVHLYLADAAVTRGDILAFRGKLEERQRAEVRALEFLEHAVEVADADVQAHINLLRMKLILARRTEATQRRAKILALEPEYLTLGERFSSSPEVFLALSSFYSEFRLGGEYINEAVQAVEKAVELAPENVLYAINAARLYHRRYALGGGKVDFLKGMEIAERALSLPGAQETTGPEAVVNRSYRARLNGNLAEWYIEQILEPAEEMTVSQRREFLAGAEQAVHEIRQILGSGEDPQAVKWEGMLELAKAEMGQGDRNAAIRKLYMTYEQMRASGRSNPHLSYVLAKLFSRSAESGAVLEFLVSALDGRIELTRPEVRLDYAAALAGMRAYSRALANVRLYEQIFGPNQRSRILRVGIYTGARIFDEAEQELQQLPANDPNTIVLKGRLSQSRISYVRSVVAQKQRQADLERVFESEDDQTQEGSRELPSDQTLAIELKSSLETLAKCVEDLLSIEPNLVDGGMLAVLCDNSIENGRFERARDLTAKYLGHFPDDTTALSYKLVLAEPDPGKISSQRRFELREQAVLGIADPIRRALNLGVLYQRNDQPDRSMEQFKKVLELTSQSAEGKASRVTAAGGLFEMALAQGDMNLAEQIASIAQRENLDECSGEFYAARLAMSKEQYEQALSDVDAALKQRPVFSYAYLLRHRINSALGNEHASMGDIQTAARMRPDDSVIAKFLAQALYIRNQQLGDNVSSAQLIETRTALDKAIALNPGDIQLLSFYAEYIGPTEPERALALRQRLHRRAPSLANSLLLAKMAIRVSLEQTGEESREALLDIAGSSLEQARTYDPENKDVLETYAEYYRLIGQEDKAQQLLAESDDWRLLWRHRVRAGEFDKAREILEQSYRTNPKDPNILEGFIFLAEQTGDKDAVGKYSGELLSVKNTVQTNLITIQAFLRVGLVKEAEKRLQSFREKNSDEPRGLLLGAWLAMRQGRLQEALKQTNRYLEVEQNNATAWRLRGQINRLTANYDQAVADLKKSRLLSDEPLTRVELAKAYVRSGRVEDAITELKSTIENPGSPEEARLLLERIYWRLGRTGLLKAFYEATLEKLPDSVYWHNRSAGFAMSTNDIPKAEELYERAWQKSREQGKGDVDAFAGHLQALLRTGKLDKLFEQAAQYVDSEFASVAYFRMAEARLKLGDKENAVEYCRKAVDKADADENAVGSILKRMYALLGPAEVEKLCNERLEAASDSFAENWMMFSLMKLSGRYNKALDYANKCIEIRGPDSTRGVRCIMQKTEVLMLAYSKTSDKKYLQDAVGEYKSLLDEMPNNTGVLNNLAYILAENDEQLDDALSYIKRAVDLKPNEPGFLDTYAFVLYKRGEYPEAAEVVQSALQQYESQRVPVPAEVYEHLGQIYEKLGETSQAIAAYEQALETGGDDLPGPVKERLNSAIQRLR